MLLTNFEKFTYSSKGNFPEAECTVQDKNELDVFYSPNVYQILYIDIRFPEERRLTYAKPYVWISEKGEKKYGWVSNHTTEIFGNIENTCQLWDEFAIGFLLADEETRSRDEELFEKYRAMVDAQYE